MVGGQHWGMHTPAGPDAPIAIMTYPNMFSIPGHPFEEPAALALGRLNGVVREVAGGYDAGVAELSDVFGHRVIAGAFVEALGLEEGRG